ncbi:MAG: hypothetical protein NVS9B15_21080 [Acidobacteriaceae bacterium]
MTAFLPSPGSHGVSSDTALLAQIAAGDRDALLQLFDRHYPIASAAAFAVLGRDDLADEVVHEVFLQVWKHPEILLQSGDSAAAWLVVASRRVAMRLRRDLNVPAPSPTTCVLPALSNSHQELVKRWFGGKTISEIAHSLGQTPRQVQQALASALKALAQQNSARSQVSERAA